MADIIEKTDDLNEVAVSHQNEDVQANAEIPEDILNKKSKKKTKVIILVVVSVLLVGLVVFALVFTIPYIKYTDAVSMMEEGEYQKAMAVFDELDDFMYSEQMYCECQYRGAIELLESEKYTDAITAFENLKEYKNSSQMLCECKYAYASSLLEEGKASDAVVIFEELGEYKDSKDKIKECTYIKACNLLEENNTKDALAIFESLKDYKDSKDKIKECKYKDALKAVEDGEIEQAYKAFADLGSYKDSKKRAETLKRDYVRIISKDKVFVNKSWIPIDRERSNIVSKVIDENTIEFRYSGAASLTEHVEEIMVATWDPTNGKLTYKGSTCYYDVAGMKTVTYSDGHGYFYYENGCLCYVNERSGYSNSFM